MRTALRAGQAGLGALMVLTAIASASAAPATCSAFKAAFLKSTADLKSSFVRPLIVSRRGPSKDDIFQLVLSAQIDGTLHCRGETLERFQAQVTSGASGDLATSFERVQVAALMAAFKWNKARALGVSKKINAEASEYLQASIQSGDVVFSGKTERHEIGGDVGMMWTPAQHTFVIVDED